MNMQMKMKMKGGSMEIVERQSVWLRSTLADPAEFI